MNYWLHPAAAEEHTRQVTYYEESQVGLGRRYHSEFLETISRVCADPKISRVVHAPDLRRAMFKIFHFDVIYREVEGSVHVLAVAHHRREPDYWAARL